MAFLSFFCIIASYCNRGRVGRGGGAVCTPGDIKTDSTLCALIEKTIKSHYKPAYNTVSLLLAKTWISTFLCLWNS